MSMKFAMSSLARPVAFSALSALLLLFTATMSFAQTMSAEGITKTIKTTRTTKLLPTQEVVDSSLAPLPDQAVQRLRTEDAGARIDELRVGGQTQSITVQPKTGMKLPSYEVKPLNGQTGSAASLAGSDTNGARVWNVLKF